MAAPLWQPSHEIMQKNFELQLSGLVVSFLAVVYIVYELIAIPAGGHPFGHTLGIIGSILMIMAETLYSARKRLSFVRFGHVRHWLSFHIFMGIVGPALVLMHTGMQFRGLAGMTTLLTVLVVASGFLGRYIYTSVPRTLAGIEIDRRTLEKELEQQNEIMLAWAVDKPQRIQALIAQESNVRVAEDEAESMAALFTRRFQEWRERRRIRAVVRTLERDEQARMAEIERVLRRHRRKVRQIRSLKTVRRLMGWWHTAHVPLGLTLFFAMTVHIIATIYYGAL